MTNSADPNQLASSVCKGRAHRGSAGQGLRYQITCNSSFIRIPVDVYHCIVAGFVFIFSVNRFCDSLNKINCNSLLCFYPKPPN